MTGDATVTADAPADAKGDRRRRLASVRRRIAEISHASNSAHFGSSLSCVEILDSIFQVSGVSVRIASDHDKPRIIMSKGHAAMVYYATLEAYGLIPGRALDRYLADGSTLWGHVTKTDAVPAIDVSTGSLGHGLSLSAGFALGHRLNRQDAAVYCVLSDGECDEGATWEAAHFAGHHRFDRLTAVIDYNKIQSLDRVEDVLSLEPFADKWRSFGWSVDEVDGHDPWSIDAAIAGPRDGRPLAVIAHTVKGKGVPRIEDTVASHYHPATAEDSSGFDA
ncbi:MAG: transketolase [Alphaproteobacteria bacterium]|nr:transketolase [Alphaproteobacteria bacterium]